MRHDSDIDVDPWERRDDEIRDLSPGTFRVVAAALIALAVLAVAGVF